VLLLSVLVGICMNYPIVMGRLCKHCTLYLKCEEVCNSTYVQNPCALPVSLASSSRCWTKHDHCHHKQQRHHHHHKQQRHHHHHKQQRQHHHYHHKQHTLCIHHINNKTTPPHTIDGSISSADLSRGSTTANTFSRLALQKMNELGS